MKINTEPSITLIARPVIDWDAVRSIIPDVHITTGNGDALPEIAGRTCYQSWQKGRLSKAYIDHILESGHGSVLECAQWVFQIHGISRALSHELVRHRAGTAISQLSQRYVDESVAEYVMPDLITKCPAAYELWKESIQHSHDKYVQLVEILMEEVRIQKLQEQAYADLEIDLKREDVPPTKPGPELRTAIRKEARQAARSVLPNATETKMQWSANTRAIRHVLEQRGNRHAETEIRKLAYKLYQIMLKESPLLFSDYTTTKLPDGTFELYTPYRKV